MKIVGSFVSRACLDSHGREYFYCPEWLPLIDHGGLADVMVACGCECHGNPAVLATITGVTQ